MIACVQRHADVAPRDSRDNHNNPELRARRVSGAISHASFAKIFDLDQELDECTGALGTIRRVHAPGYVDFLSTAYESARRSGDADWFSGGALVPNHFAYKLTRAAYEALPIYKRAGVYANDVMTPIRENTWDSACWSGAMTYTAAHAVATGNARVGYALNTTPGHHATRDGYGGYCFLNNPAIAAERLREYGRVAILDIDYHHGNGQQAIYYEKSGVFTVSIHADPAIEYPSFTGYTAEIGEEEGAGYNMNIIGKTSCDIGEYRTYLQTAVNAIRERDCKALVVAFGGDTFKDDPDKCPLGGFGLKVEDYREVGNVIGRLGLPTVVTQEGGYAIDSIGPIVYNFLSGISHAV